MQFNFLKAFPFFVALMERKTVAAYLSVFAEFKKVCIERNIQIEKIVSDYESALRLAAGIVFNEAQLVGCWFHYARATYKRSRALKLCQSTNEQMRQAIRMATGVPLLPHNLVSVGFDVIRCRI